MIYKFERRGRSTGSLIVLGVIWAVTITLTLLLNLALWIAAALLVFTLPALWDYIRDSKAEIEVWPNRLVWRAAFSDGDRSDIDHVRLNRRFDGTVKVLLVHVGGATTRLPPDIAPPIAPFESALNVAGITTQRNPFLPF